MYFLFYSVYPLCKLLHGFFPKYFKIMSCWITVVKYLLYNVHAVEPDIGTRNLNLIFIRLMTEMCTIPDGVKSKQITQISQTEGVIQREEGEGGVEV